MAQKSFDLNNQKDVEEKMKILLAEDDEDPMVIEDLGEESDIASEDEVEERNEDSCTEQDCTDKSDI